MVTLGSHHRPALATNADAAADGRCGYTLMLWHGINKTECVYDRGTRIEPMCIVQQDFTSNLVFPFDLQFCNNIYVIKTDLKRSKELRVDAHACILRKCSRSCCFSQTLWSKSIILER